MWVQSLGLKDPLEKETATHSGILASDAIVNGIIFFISFSANSLQMYKSTTAFCSVSYPATLQKLLIKEGVLVESLRFSTYKIMSSATRDNFLSPY